MWHGIAQALGFRPHMGEWISCIRTPYSLHGRHAQRLCWPSHHTWCCLTCNSVRLPPWMLQSQVCCTAGQLAPAGNRPNNNVWKVNALRQSVPATVVAALVLGFVGMLLIGSVLRLTLSCLCKLCRCGPGFTSLSSVHVLLEGPHATVWCSVASWFIRSCLQALNA